MPLDRQPYQSVAGFELALPDVVAQAAPRQSSEMEARRTSEYMMALGTKWPPCVSTRGATPRPSTAPHAGGNVAEVARGLAHHDDACGPRKPHADRRGVPRDILKHARVEGLRGEH